MPSKKSIHLSNLTFHHHEEFRKKLKLQNKPKKSLHLSNLTYYQNGVSEKKIEVQKTEVQETQNNSKKQMLLKKNDFDSYL